MGVVYRAYDTTLEREIALKELLGPATATPELREELIERFQREARAAARLSHPNVVQVFDVAIQDGRYFIAMELLDGLSLTTVIESGVSQQSAIQLLLQMLDAVQAAHEAGVVHRDLKPDNIFVLDDGRVKVTDFGIARLAETTGASSMTQIGTVMGTPGYMAPEQVMGLPVDGRADIFSLGVMGYELFSGVNPFVGPSTTTTLYRIVNEQPAPLDTQGLSMPISAVIDRALAKAPETRYQTAAAMAHDLRTGVLPGSRPVVGEANAGGQGSHSWSTRWIAVGGVAALVVAGLAAFGSLPGKGASPTTTATTAAPVVVAAPSVSGEAVTGETLIVTLEQPVSPTAKSADLVIDGVSLGAARVASPFSWSWRPSDAGDYRLAVRVLTAGGRSMDGAAVTVSIRKPATAPVPDSTNAADLNLGGFWTAVFASEKSESAAEQKAKGVIAQGYEADTLLSDEWENLKPGWYVAFSGVFSNEAKAQARVKELKSSGYDAYARYTGACMVGD